MGVVREAGLVSSFVPGAAHCTAVVRGRTEGVGLETWLATTRSGVDVRDNAGLHRGHGREQRRDGDGGEAE